jgi:hypothetical protein
MKHLLTGSLPVVLITSSCPLHAATKLEPPPLGCVAVQKKEYDAAKKKGLLRTRNGEYVRTGGFGAGKFWYCH